MIGAGALANRRWGNFLKDQILVLPNFGRFFVQWLSGFSGFLHGSSLFYSSF